MKHIAILILTLIALPAAAAEQWQWVKVVNNIAGWQTQTGPAKVTIEGQSFKAELFWGKAQNDSVRITLVGSIEQGQVTATETVEDSDLGPSPFSGKYQKHRWDEPFDGFAGMETILLNDGYSMIGLRRNIAK